MIKMILMGTMSLYILNNKKLMKQDLTIKEILKEKKLGKKIVLCHGVFDVLHTGHLKYFKQAKKLGDILVVSVTIDKFVNKGPLRPINKLNERILFLKNLNDVDFVLESNFPTAVNIINKVKPNVYCKGPDYKFQIKKDKNLIKEIIELKNHKGKFVTVDHVSRSSSNIIQKQDNLKKDIEILNQIQKVKNKFTYKDIISLIKILEKKKVLVLGEMIIDKYMLAEAVGKSGKDPMLVFREIGSKKYLGGSAYIANLCSSISKTSYISHIGEKESQLNFIKSNLNKKIKFKFLKKKDCPTITKLRYIDHYKKSKIIGFYNIDDRELNKIEETKYINILHKSTINTDLIILADYGHGEITQKTRKKLQNFSNKLYLNTQINSFNSSYHTLKSYKKINTLCINESELRFEMKDKNSLIHNLSKKLQKEIKFENLIITSGKKGSTLISKNKVYHCPAFEKNPLDTIGSGDTFFSLVSLLLSQKTDPDLALTIASLGAAFSVRSLGHKKYYNFYNLKDDLKLYFK